MSKKDFDLDKEIEKIARKSNINMQRTEYSFDNQLRKLDKDIEKIMSKKIKDFDENKELSSKYLSIDYKSSTIDQYKERLKKF